MKRLAPPPDSPEEEIAFPIWCFVCGQQTTDENLPCADCADHMDLGRWADFTHSLSQQKSAIERDIERAKERIKVLLTEPKTAYAGSYQVAWRQYDRDQMDFKRLKSEQWDLYQAYTTKKPVNAIYIDTLHN